MNISDLEDLQREGIALTPRQLAILGFNRQMKRAWHFGEIEDAARLETELTTIEEMTDAEFERAFPQGTGDIA